MYISLIGIAYLHWQLGALAFARCAPWKRRSAAVGSCRGQYVAELPTPSQASSASPVWCGPSRARRAGTHWLFSAQPPSAPTPWTSGESPETSCGPCGRSRASPEATDSCRSPAVLRGLPTPLSRPSSVTCALASGGSASAPGGVASLSSASGPAGGAGGGGVSWGLRESYNISLFAGAGVFRETSGLSRCFLLGWNALPSVKTFGTHRAKLLGDRLPMSPPQEPMYWMSWSRENSPFMCVASRVGVNRDVALTMPWRSLNNAVTLPGGGGGGVVGVIVTLP